MIPIQLILKNFLSYREASLDFRGLHTACICGTNGAGKSSLLEAMTWAIWGKCRASNEDDAILRGASDGRVDFRFICHQQNYRIIRSRMRGKGSRLEFQVDSGDRWLSLTAKSVKVTQEKINQTLRIDYETFINSAYLRQGHADEFMLRTPSRRKDILVELLKLDRYEVLANEAKDRAKHYKAQAEQWQASLQPIAEQLAARPDIETQQQTLDRQRQTLQLALDRGSAQLAGLQAQQRERQLSQQQLTWQQSQLQTLNAEIDRLRREEIASIAQLQTLRSLLDRADEIQREYAQLQSLQHQEQILSQKFQTYQQLQLDCQAIERDLNQRQHQLQLQQQNYDTQLKGLKAQIDSLNAVLQQSEEIETALAQLQHHRQILGDLDRRQQESTPLLHRQRELTTRLAGEKARLSAQIEQLQQEHGRDRLQLAKEPQLRSELERLGQCLHLLDQKDQQFKQIEDKGKDDKTRQEKLQDRLSQCREESLEIEDKLRRLAVPDAHCPLCEQDLDRHYRHRVTDKTQQRQRELQTEIQTLETQIVELDRELTALRRHHRQLKDELSQRKLQDQQFIQVETQLDAIAELEGHHHQRQQTLTDLQKKLETHDYARDLHQERQAVEDKLRSLAYDEQAHRQQRAEVERWRWAEIQQAKLADALTQKTAIERQIPQIEAEIAKLVHQIATLHHQSDLQQRRDRLQQELAALNYDASAYNQLLLDLRQAQPWQNTYQQWQAALEQYPPQSQRLGEIQSQLSQREAEKTALQPEIDRLSQQLTQQVDPAAAIATLEQALQQQRQELDLLLAQQGRIEQTLLQLDDLDRQRLELTAQSEQARRQYRIHNELALAFGKNGIQALMIENVLPQLESEANQILARLTQNQLHIQFITQKTGKTTRRQAAKFIETLDILIADAQGTRPYETYSGGEAFRINFAIRLALAKLLAQKSGVALQMLIIDEGFGTQDSEGCDRLVAAINAIAPDFACILAVTHMPQFKEAFQHRIEVNKGDGGSSLQLVS